MKYFLLGIIACGLIISCLNSGKQHPQPSGFEYQFNVDNTGYDIYRDDTVFIGRINYGENPTLDSLISFDNQ